MAVTAENDQARVVLGEALLSRFAGGTLRLYAGSNSANNYITSHALGSPAGTVAANGQLQLGAIGVNQQSINAGSVDHGSLVSSSGHRQYRFTVSNVAGNGVDAVFSPSNYIALGIPVVVPSFVFNIAQI